jgi:hypothetical protein
MSTSEAVVGEAADWRSSPCERAPPVLDIDQTFGAKCRDCLPNRSSGSSIALHQGSLGRELLPGWDLSTEDG